MLGVFLAEGLACVIFGIASNRLKLVSSSGSVGLIIITSGAILGFGVPGFAYLIGIFVMSSAVTRYSYSAKSHLGAAEAHGGARGLWKIIGGAGVAGMVAWGAYLHLIPSSIGELGFAASAAATNADTWASELGVLSRDPPHLITPPWNEVQRGVSGGVSGIGEVAALMGALSASLLVVILGLQLTVLGITSCFAGAIAAEHLDSVLGASLQAIYRCPVCNTISERRRHHEHGKGILIRGIPFLSNEGVNLFSCFFAMFASTAIFVFFQT